jgi:hypothetical protein
VDPCRRCWLPGCAITLSPAGRENGFVEIVFRQDLQDLLDFIFCFQFPDETENTQSPSAN